MRKAQRTAVRIVIVLPPVSVGRDEAHVTNVCAQADSSTVLNLEPFASSNAKNSFIPSMVSVDPASQLIFVMDAGAGEIGAVALKNGKLTLAWSQDQTTLSFTTLVGPQD